jgi:hypothetical protein
LKKDLKESRIHLNKFDNGKLDEILSNKKFASDKTGLDFDKFAASSSKSNSTPKEVVFVKATNEVEATPNTFGSSSKEEECEKNGHSNP